MFEGEVRYPYRGHSFFRNSLIFLFSAPFSHLYLMKAILSLVFAKFSYSFVSFFYACIFTISYFVSFFAQKVCCALAISTHVTID